MHLRRRTFIVGIGAAIAWPRVLLAQSRPALRRIGYLTTSNPANSPGLASFRDALRARGHVEGRDLVIEYRWADSALPELAADLVHADVEAIVAVGTPALIAAKEASSTIPIVMISGSEAAANVTGIDLNVPELTARLVELLPQVAPGTNPIALLRNPANPAAANLASLADGTARVLGLYVQPFDARSPADFEPAFAAMKKRGMQGVVILGDPMFAAHARRLGELALRARLPSIHTSRAYAEAGGLMSYGPVPDQLGRLAAIYVDKILRGAQPADLPVERPTQFELVVNATTAKKLGVLISGNAMARAHKVVY